MTIAIYNNGMLSIEVEDIIYDIDDYLKIKGSIKPVPIHYDDNGDPYVNIYHNKVYLSEFIRTDI